ncbi:phosphatase PAP2 family protein [Maribrevibacterium harenarium]|uniref:undecaprenyl-diphosphate phosphatase n=1 Tax=Maribrevibacterium harenarium TaxID=2589817 RepID=A0A501X442_9GAMM|nr:phosphatase PAP2 family protein [Maribrevibacterium harenarium]TPE55221.1 phosphatase PAP2 family protein [Maribrevibacterium harenarium]
MSALLNRFYISKQYQSLIHTAQEQRFSPKKSDYIALSIIAMILGVTALLGFVVEGYHFAFLSINALNPYIPDLILEWVTSFGDTMFLLGLILIFATRNVQYHWSILFACVVAGLAINLLKDYFAMPRPPAVLDAGSFYLTGKAYMARSFPSGHSFTAFLVATISFFYLPKTWMKWSVIGLACMTALSRVVIGVHWTADVTVGGALGTLFGMFCVWATCCWRLGVCKLLHLFTLVLMLLVTDSVFFTGNDYPLALPLMYLVAFLALVQVVRYYLLPVKTTAST